MKVLAIDTSGILGGVAIMDSDTGLLVESRVNVKAVAHSERLMTEVDGALARCGLGLSELDALVVAAGPGSFSGIRIGIATVKGLAFATGIKAVAVSSLEAFAWGIGGGGCIVSTMFDARKKAVYGAGYRCGAGGVGHIIAEAAYPAPELAHKLLELGEDIILAGDGAIAYKEVFSEILGDRAVFAPPHQMVPSPSALAHLGILAAQRGEYTQADVLGPVYMRRPEAEVKLPTAGGG